jgi:uroporphyrinogen decarboxylase
LQDTGVWIYDDMCNLRGPMFSPAAFEKVFMPTYRRMVSELKAAGARWVMLHCDGNLRPLLPMLLDVGIDGINPVEYSAGLDVVELVEEYRGRLRFMGGVCNTHILPSGDKEEITRHVERIVDAARDGGIIIGTHSVGPDIPIDVYEFYREVIATHGDYAKQGH